MTPPEFKSLVASANGTEQWFVDAMTCYIAADTDTQLLAVDTERLAIDWPVTDLALALGVPRYYVRWLLDKQIARIPQIARSRMLEALKTHPRIKII